MPNTIFLLTAMTQNVFNSELSGHPNMKEETQQHREIIVS